MEPVCGQIWYGEGGGDFLGKGRPVLILQNDAFQDLDSIVIVPFTSNSDSAQSPLIRIEVPASGTSGLQRTSWLMIDKTQAVKRVRLKRHLGALDDVLIAEAHYRFQSFMGCHSQRAGLFSSLLRLLRLSQ